MEASGAEAVAEVAGELDEVAELGCLGGGGVAEGELGFEQEAGEGGLSSLCRMAVAAVRAGARSWARRARAAAGLADDARGAGEGEVELEDEGAAGVW